MDSWPFDIETVAVTWGDTGDGRGQAAPVVARITAVFLNAEGERMARIVWRPTGFNYLSNTEALLAKAGEARTVHLPVTDQDGWSDPSGNAYTSWYYEVVLELGYGRELATVTHRIQPVSGQAQVILGSLPEPGAPGQPVIVQVPAVLSVNGRTGHVVVEGGEGAPGGSAGVEVAILSPLATWTIPHDLGRRPSVTLWTTGGVEFEADVTATPTTVIVSHPIPTAGSVTLS